MSGPPKQKAMVGWYDPRQLAMTGIEVAISTIFGRHSDHRLVEAMAGKETRPFYDYSYFYEDNGKDVCKPDASQPRNSIWIDYVGDVGDGWNSTYAVAYYIAERSRTFTYVSEGNGKQQKVNTERGAILIFGGDEVYPTASREEYDHRLVAPYEAALKFSDPPCPHVFAVPGNHDWYDSLVAFTRVFTARRWFAGWRTRQERSYFALRLPHNWWLLGTDLQLGSDIDKPQLDYFERLAAVMDEQTALTGERARIIVCHAEPHWIRAAQYGGYDPNYNESNLQVLENRLRRGIAVFIAGDLHHYRRHEALDKSVQKITAGGGGAFLHPTHSGLLGTTLDTFEERDHEGQKVRTFRQQRCFPPEKKSSWLCWRNLTFPLFIFKGNKSWPFGFVTAVLYLLLMLPLLTQTNTLTVRGTDLSYMSYAAILHIFNSSLSIPFIVLVIVGFLFFTDTHSKRQRFLMGGIHSITHILAAFFIALISVSLVAAWLPDGLVIHIPWLRDFSFDPDLRPFLSALLVMFGGFVVGSFIMGAYLLISLNFWGRHGNEAFSSLAIEDWKNFLRLHIDENGDLTIYPIGIRRVPRKWKERSGQTEPQLVPDPNDKRATAPELIEPPIVLRKAATETGVRCSNTSVPAISPAAPKR